MASNEGPTIAYGGRHWPLEPNVPLTIGRGAGCTVRLPADPFVSRRAASITAVDEYLLIRNLSSTQSLTMRPPVGEDRMVEPLAASTSLPFRVFQVVITGEAGTEWAIDVTVGTPVGSPPKHAAPRPAPADDPATVTRPFALTRSQRRIVTALCEPLVTLRGPQATPATYQQIGERLNLRPQYVRKVIQELRDALTGYGVPGLATGEQQGAEDFRLALARLAIRSGWIDDDE